MKLVQLNLKLFMNKKILRLCISNRSIIISKQPNYFVVDSYDIDELIKLGTIREDVTIKYE